VTVALGAILGAVLAGPARAQEPAPDPGSSAVDQYVEQVPTGSGSKTPGVEKERKAPLAPNAKRALDKTSKSTADALTTVATSSYYGAPFTPGLGGAASVPTDAPSPVEPPSLDRTLQATAAAAAPVDDARMIVLLLALLAIGVAGGVLGARRRRL
jgi:hypothetical protein